jgi:S1-C subfamily serine protease
LHGRIVHGDDQVLGAKPGARGRAVGDDLDDLMREVSGELIGESVRLDVIREGTQRAVEVVPVELAA